YGFANQTQSLFDVYDNPTNNLNVFRITSDGSVGIATSSPFRKLSVEGSAWISGDLTANSFTATSSMSAPYFTATDSSATSTFAGGLAVGTNKFVVDYSTGNVGVGTVSPDQKLDVNGWGRFEGAGSTNRSDSGAIEFYNNNASSLNVQAQIKGLRGIGSYNSGQLGFFTRLAGTLYERMTLDENGNVGIGTMVPGYKLDIAGSVAAPTTLLVQAGGITENTGNAFRVYRNRASSSTNAPLVDFINDAATDDQPLFRLQQDAPADILQVFDGATQVFTILDGGNVGIGTTSPLAKLSVKGAGTTTGINFQTTNSADTPLVTVLDSGNVGIGTVSPGAKLEVFGDMIIGDVTNGSVFRYNPTTNTIVNGAHENSIGVGSSNSIIAAGGATASSNINSIGTDSYVTTISGGYDNTIGNDSPAATISGGAHHRIDTGGTHGTIGGGSTNTIQAGGDYGFIGAGLSNIVGGTYAFIGAGSNNVATGFRSAVMGGYSNDATGQYATIPGGWGNAASGDYSFAFGYRANAAATGVVVFKDSVNAQYTVNTTNMFGANFTGGYQLLGGNVGIGTTSPFAKLSVKGAGTTTGVNFQTTNSADTPLVTVLDSGNVGIGTTNPGAMLELSSISINGSVLRLSNNNNTIAQGEELGSIEFFSGDNSGSYPDTVKAKILSLTEDSVSRDGNLVFKTSLLSDASPVERMRINSNGNVGIGSTSPFAKLSVKGAGTTTGINFQTTNSANTPLVTVLDSGNVGIGTTAPSEKLEVAGNILLWNSVNDNTLRFKDNNVAHGLTDLVSTYIHTELRNEDVSAGGTRLLGVTDQDLASGINLYGVLGVTDPTDTVPAIKINGAKKNTTNVQSLGNLETVFQVQNNTSPLLTLLGNGNLGIGTTSPFAKLSVVGDVVADYFNATSTTATSTFAGGLTVGTNKLVVDRSTGNVGIGTASPSQMLSVGASSQFTVTSAGVVTGQNFAVTSGAYVIDVSNGLRLYSNGGLGIKFTTWDGSYVDRMVVSTTGNIGIGTTSPFAKLSVTGTGTGTGSAFQVADSANSPKFTVLDNGNVGVGTVSPTQKLDVNGNIHLGSSVDDLTTRNIYLASNRYLSLTSTGLDVSNWYGSDGSAHKVGFNGKEVLVVGSNGIVAIGNNINGGPGDYMPLVLQGNESGDVLIKSDQYQWGVDTRPIRIITDDPYANTGQTLNAGNIVLQTGIGTNGGATGIIKFEIGASGSEKMRIDTSGNIGIGTTTPWRTLSVNGTAAFTGLTNDGTGYYACISTNGELATSTTACGASSERFKTNINDLTYGLDTVLQLRPVSFNWKSDFINSSSTQIGFIAEEVDLLIPEVIGHDDKGNIMNLDYPKLTAVLVGAMKELNTKISAIASSTPIVSTGIVDSVLSHLESLGAKFVDGIAYFKDVVVKTLTAEKVITNGIEMVDEVTGEIYCVRIQNGAMVNIAGTCDTANSQQPTAEPSNTTPPTITITGNNPAVVEINSNYIDLGATAVDYQGNSLIVDTIDADTVDTTTAGEYTVTYTTFDGTLTSTSTRTVLVEDSTAVTTEPATTTEPTATTTNPVVEPTATTTDPVVEPTATTTEQI
ncbi:TPA: hypothetical protein DCP88_03760, partial [Candidatus Campbellbacteria bacterium]|nr:hypothetical protein [Candidatus Campbellbacteria bacterium]